MKILAALLSLLLVASLAYQRLLPDRGNARHDKIPVVSGPFEQWTSYEGTLESRNLQLILSPFQGTTTITWLIPDGTHVSHNDLVAELDDSRISRELVKLRHELRAARADLASLEHAELPLVKADLEHEKIEIRHAIDTEKQYLFDSRQLLAEELVSPHEVTQQEHKLRTLEARLERLSRQLALTREFIHPTRIERAKATVAALEYQIGDLEEQAANCRIHAPAAGMVTHLATWIGGEYRTARVGDSLNQNQPLMSIPDMTLLAASCHVPEADLARVQPGLQATITPVAFPDLRLAARVESVGTMAQRLRGMPAWQKYFTVNIHLLEHDDRLRTGMSVHASILSYSTNLALQIPRSAVQWTSETPWCLVHTPEGPRKRTLRLGRANLLHYQVLEGLRHDDLLIQ